jgi:ABC-2 type transport system ATP-binding protein
VRFLGAPDDLLELARGRVWSAAERDPGARLSWRTGTGTTRNIGEPPAGAELVAPTLEDAYLLLLGRDAAVAA